MSFDYVDGAIASLNNQVSSYAGEPISAMDHGPSLVDVLAAQNSASIKDEGILQPNSDMAEIDDPADPSSILYLDLPSDDPGGSIEVSEPAIYVPEGFTADDLYAVEFILDPTTGVLTINLLFSTDPADHQPSMSALGSISPSTDALMLDSGGDVSPVQANPSGGSRCTITLTKTTTQTSPTTTVSLFGGIVSHTSGSTTETTTRTITVEGHLVNGRCVVDGDKR
ncbi:MAG TPA: hypothetical protein VF574_06055 [Allosphingosinicella sp.]|jgi:hypothetical protein